MGIRRIRGRVEDEIGILASPGFRMRPNGILIDIARYDGPPAGSFRLYKSNDAQMRDEAGNAFVRERCENGHFTIAVEVVSPGIEVAIQKQQAIDVFASWGYVNLRAAGRVAVIAAGIVQVEQDAGKDRIERLRDMGRCSLALSRRHSLQRL